MTERPTRTESQSLGPRLAGGLLRPVLWLARKVLPVLPRFAVLGSADVAAFVVRLVDRRGRRVARENLRAVLGDEVSPAERRRIVRAAYRSALRAMVLLFHLQPLSPERFRRWVDLTPEDEARFLEATSRRPSVIVSGHFGNWELLLASRSGVPGVLPLAYLAESTGIVAVDETLDRLRDRGGGAAALRRGGALALRRALADGKSVALLVDRNVRGHHGGRYVPFLGLPARTTPLPAMLARRYGVPLHVILCAPAGEASWRLWASPDLSGPPSDDERADAAAATERVNAVLSRVIRERPDAWLWTIKRWKSRPTKDLGPYPAYSLFDPD